MFLRPDSDITTTGFTGGFANIDEATASDADFAYGDRTTTGTLEVGLGNPATTPGSGTVTIRYRLASTFNGSVTGSGETVNVHLYQGATLKASDSVRTANSTWTQYSFTVDASSITDWNDLRVRVVQNNVNATYGAAISWIEVEAPDTPSTTPELIRPDGNVTQTSWTSGGFAEIDEATASDTDRAYSSDLANGGAGTARLEVSLANPSATPTAAAATTVRYRVGKVLSGNLNSSGTDVLLTCSVYQGTTLIASDVQRTLTSAYTDYSFTPNMGSVTDWNNLRLRFDLVTSGTGGARGGAVSWAEMEVPLVVLGGKLKVWNGSAWVEKPVKAYIGGSWVEKPVKVWNGSAWVLT